MPSVPRCECGLYAVGECVECDAPLCQIHLCLLAERVVCREHLEVHEAADAKRLADQLKVERKARRQATKERREAKLGGEKKVEDSRAKARREVEASLEEEQAREGEAPKADVFDEYEDFAEDLGAEELVGTLCDACSAPFRGPPSYRISRSRLVCRSCFEEDIGGNLEDDDF